MMPYAFFLRLLSQITEFPIVLFSILDKFESFIMFYKDYQ